MLWCYVMGSTCGIAATLDPRAVTFRTTMDALNIFMNERNLPRHSRILIRTYFHNTRHLHHAGEENMLFSECPSLTPHHIAHLLCAALSPS